MWRKRTRTIRQPAPGPKPGLLEHTLLLAAAVLAAGVVVAWTLPRSSESTNTGAITVWQPPTHRCCTEWVFYLRRRGYRVIVNHVADVVPVKVDLEIPAALYSCHTAKVGAYIVEGHVPAPAIAKLLGENPDLKGIAVPGMPAGPPGMGGSPGLYPVMGFTADGRTYRFADVGI
jgi:hypothetical protein